MNRFDDFKKYLPQYLSEASVDKLLDELKAFPDNINKRLYTAALNDMQEIYQGDGISNMLTVRLPDPQIVRGPVMIMSNSCDVSFENVRWMPPKFTYCPIVKLANYIQNLRARVNDQDKIDSHIQAVREQAVSSIFFLPEGGKLPGDCVALLDSMNSCDLSVLQPEGVVTNRLFSLSNYGFYLLLFKIAVHLTRLREGVDRG